MRMLLALLCLFFSTSVSAMDIPDAASPAAQLYVDRCSTCHALAHPARLDWPHWRSMLHVMKLRMSERGMEMPDEEWRQIAGYLKQHAR